MRWLVVLALVSSAALADDDGVHRETIAVGQTIERDVGYAVGYQCDDNTIVTVEMKTRTRDDTNVVVIRGDKAGKTTCRIGTDPVRTSFVYEITVQAKRGRR